MPDKWIPIFRAGKQTDSSGREHDGTSLIEKAVKNFKPDFHEPPVVIGHPKDNAPAFGWVDGLKREGDLLLASFKDLQPEFVDMTRRNLFKKRSASFYPDGSLRHVGFLGAAPPAVKGLADVAFNEAESLTFEFSDGAADHKFGAVARVLRGLREMLIGKFDEETADKVVGNYELEFIAREEKDESLPAFEEGAGNIPKLETKEKDMSKTFTEEDLAKAKEEGKREAKEKASAEFAEKTKADNERISELEKKVNTEKAERQKAEISAFCESLKNSGRYLPAWDESGLPEFMESLDRESPIEFSEGAKKTPLEFMQGFLKSLPKVVDFSEVSGGDDPSDTDDRESAIAEFAEKNKVDYKTAAIEVAKKRPELFG